MSGPEPGFSEPPDGSWATFHLGEETFAVAAEHVHEILTSLPLTPVPLAPDHVVGLVNLRGQVMPAVDLRRRLQLPDRALGRPSSLVVLNTAGGLAAAVVDAIGDVVELPSDAWRPPPETLGNAQRACVFGICPLDDRLLLGLRVEALDPEHETREPGGSP